MNYQINKNFKLVVVDPPREVSLLNIEDDKYIKFNGIKAHIIKALFLGQKASKTISSISHTSEIEESEASIIFLKTIKELINLEVVTKP